MNHALIFSLGSRDAIRGRTSGVYRVATEMRSLGWDVEVVDFFYFWSLEQLKELCNSRITTDTKFIGFSHIFTEWPQLAEDLCAWIKEQHPDIIILFGSNAYQDLKSKYIDYYMSGYGEVALKVFLEWKFSNGPRPIITPVDNNRVILAQTHYTAAPWKNPIILYEDRDFIEPYEFLGVEFSRGCKFKCAYCNFPMLGVRGDWSRDTDNFELQMRDAYDRFGTHRYVVSDETFNDRTEKIEKFANVVETLPFEPFFNAHIRGDLLVARPQDKEQLLRMGVRAHFYGVESFNHESAKVCGKGMESERLKQGLLDIREYFQTHGNGLYRGTIALIAGLPFETEEKIAESYQWLLDNWMDQSMMINPLDIYKNSAMNQSKFEQNYEKYGYRDMAEEDIVGWDESSLASGPGFVSNVVIWENDYTNYFKIRKLVKDLRQNGFHDFKQISFNLSGDLSGKDLNHMMTLTGHQLNKEQHRAFADRYIERKLSL